MSDNIINLINIILQINKVEIFEQLLLMDYFNIIIDDFIAISFILFDANEENKEKIKNIFQNKILIYFIYITLIKSDNYNNENIDNYLTNNNLELKNALDLYYLK